MRRYYPLWILPWIHITSEAVSVILRFYTPGPERCYTIRIRYLDRSKGQHRCASLQPTEFIRRFQQHVLPKGFHKVRHYGLLSPRYREKLNHLQRELGEPIPP